MDNKEQDKLIRDAQFRKGASIAYFNSVNAAIELLKNLEFTANERQKQIIYWRDWFLEEQKSYYLKNVMNIGNNFNLADSLAKLKNVKNLEELKNVWVSMSADERQEKSIIEEKNKLKDNLK